MQHQELDETRQSLMCVEEGELITQHPSHACWASSSPGSSSPPQWHALTPGRRDAVLRLGWDYIDAPTPGGPLRTSSPAPTFNKRLPQSPWRDRNHWRSARPTPGWDCRDDCSNASKPEGTGSAFAKRLAWRFCLPRDIYCYCIAVSGGRGVQYSSVYYTGVALIWFTETRAAAIQV